MAIRDTRDVLPLFSEAAAGGVCPRCGGHQFKRAAVRHGRAAAGIGQGGVGGIIGIMLAARRSGEHVECATCGMTFRKG